MKKYAFFSLGLGLLISAISVREWLLNEEIEATQKQVYEQITQHILNASTVERVRELSSSSVAFERYISPLIEISNRLLWPGSRESIVSNWKRSVHTHLEETSIARLKDLALNVDIEIKKLHTEMKPGIARLYKVVDIAQGQNAQMSCSDTVKSEMKAIRETSELRDQETLAHLKSEGQTQLRQLKKTLTGMTHKQISNYFTSGRFNREIQEPVMGYILKIKQEEIRLNAWNEFRKSIANTLAGQSVKLDKVADKNTKTKKELEKLIDAMAKNSAMTAPSTSADIMPLDNSFNQNSNFGAPAPVIIQTEPSEDSSAPENTIIENSFPTPENPADTDQ